MQHIRLELEPWLFGASLGGEPVPARWARDLCDIGVQIDLDAPRTLDGHLLGLTPSELAEVLAGTLDLSTQRLRDFYDLWSLECRELAQTLERLARAGVQIVGTGPALVGPRVQVEPGAQLWPGCVLLGQTHIEVGAIVRTGCHLTDVHVGPHAQLKPFTVAERAQIGPSAQIGPFSHLRPDSRIDAQAHVGNFVETKNTHLQTGAKANHLTYLGDATVGEGANIGAGTITCNYDGGSKHPTTIGAGAFIGSNTALVAPIHVGDHALVAAGSTIHKDVPAKALAIARAPQTLREEAGFAYLQNARAKKA